MFQSPNLNRIEASFRNYIQSNPTTFSAAPTDDWRQVAHGFVNFKNANVRDATAYATEPVEDSWVARVNGQQSPTRNGSGAAVNSGIVRSGGQP